MPTSIEPRPCFGVVLAGGQSSRMGRDKALLDWHGRPLIERQIAVLCEAGVDAVQVSGERADYRGIADAQPHCGPLGGIAGVAAAHAGDIDLLLIPVDMPLLGAALLRRLRLEQTSARGLRCADHVLPMRLRLDSRLRAQLPLLLQSQTARERSLRALQQAIDCAWISIDADEAAQLVDCNTPSLWQQVHA